MNMTMCRGIDLKVLIFDTGYYALTSDEQLLGVGSSNTVSVHLAEKLADVWRFFRDRAWD
jgi:hypothetical protein